MAALNDAHCHFFSQPFFRSLGGDAALAKLGFDAPGTAEQLADRWVQELDENGVARAALIASVPGDAESVGAAVARHPSRFVGYCMVDPTQPDAAERAADALDRGRLRTLCLFPALHGYALHDPCVERMFAVAAARPGSAIFVHCGVLSIGVRKKLGLPGPLHVRFGNPLDLQATAARHPSVPVIVPHFGAGMLREALMLADLCANVLLDTSSGNGWLKYHPGLSLADVFRQAIAVCGPDRLLFGTDSSWFPRGWVRSVHTEQCSVLETIGAPADVRSKILGGNFDRVFPLAT